MAINNFSQGYIEPGEENSQDWYFVYTAGDGNMGAQYFSVQPLDPEGKIVVSHQGKSLRKEDRHCIYHFTITNYGPKAVRFTIQGGGLI